MSKVTSIFSRRTPTPEVEPRHRLDGWFDEQDQWHAAEPVTATADQV